MDFWLVGNKKTVGGVIKESFKEWVSFTRMVFLSVHDMIVGKYGLSDLAGPVGTVSVVSTAVKTIAYSMLRIMALLTINVGLLKENSPINGIGQSTPSVLFYSSV